MMKSQLKRLLVKLELSTYEILCDFGMRLHKIYIDNTDGDENVAN